MLRTATDWPFSNGTSPLVLAPVSIAKDLDFAVLETEEDAREISNLDAFEGVREPLM